MSTQDSATYLLMNSRSDIFVSCRRSHLDIHLRRVRSKIYGNVLDVGGRRINRRGAFVPPIDSVKSWTVVNPDEVERADVTGGLPNLPFEDGVFDTVVCTEVLEYIEKPADAIQEMARVLTPRGTLYLSVPFLHVLHGDASVDCFRFTSTYIRRQAEACFLRVEIFPMGGIASVIFDLMWQRLRCYRLFRPLLRTLGPIVVRRDRPASDITTGFFVVASTPRL